MLLCFACVETLCALELVYRSDVFYSSVLQSYCVAQFSLVGSQWNGCAKASLVLQYCLAILIVVCKPPLAKRIVRICTKHSVFSGKRRFRCEETLARVR